MVEKNENNPLSKIFKQVSSSIITEEIENPSNIPLFFNYLKGNNNSINNRKKILDKFIEILKKQRTISPFFSEYENKSIYIFLLDLYLNEKNSKEFKESIITLIYELSSNIQITKDIYHYIFQKFSVQYRQDKKLLLDINKSPKLFNDYFYDLLNFLYYTFGKIEKNKKNPRNYFACFGNNNFTLNFDKKDFILGKCLSIIINFKITASKLVTENSEHLGKCSLIKINFKEDNKTLDAQLKYPFFVILNDQKKVYTAKVCPVGEWINLTMTIVVNDGNAKIFFFINGENSLLPLKIKNLKLQNNDVINSITFFDNFYGEVTSISMLSINNDNSLNIFSQTLKYFAELESGLWKKRYLNNFIHFLQGITYEEKKEEGGKEENLSKNIVFIFTPLNYNINQPNIVEDCFGKYNLIINGRIKNHKFQNYQKKIALICNINNFLPIFEMILIFQKELLNENNIILYLKLISKVVSGKNNLLDMNESNFFKLLSLFIEKLPNNFLNENILEEFDNIGKNILKHNIKNFCSNFFNDILLNEKIIFKFTKNLQIQLWNIILNLTLSDKGRMESFISIKKISSLLRYYDKNRYNEICCRFHYNMYKKEFIVNIKIMEPTLNELLIYIEKILEVLIINENPDKILSLYKLLMLDLSPCLIKFILKIFINGLYNKKIKDEWKNKLALEIINSKYEIITVNAFSHSLPDVRYEILILMYFIFIRLIRLNKLAEFTSFEKMIKTCLLPQEMFYMNKISDNLLLGNENDFDAIVEFNINNNNQEKNKNEKKINNIEDNKNKKEKIKEYDNKNKDKKNENETALRTSKSNSIHFLASKFENNNNNTNEKKGIKNEKEIINEKSKIMKNKIDDKYQKQKTHDINQQNIISKNFNQRKISDNINTTKTLNNNLLNNDFKRKDEIYVEYIDFKEGKSIYNKNNKKETLIFRDELFDIYINSLYILFLKWTFGIPIQYTYSSSSELFSSLKQQKDISSKIYFIMNLNIFDFIFVLNNDLNNINFTYRCLKKFEKLIQLPENSFIILSNDKTFSSLIDITFKYYKIIKNNNCIDIEKEMYTIGKNILICILINSMNYVNQKKNDPPMEKLETFFLWGEKIILSDINDNERINSVLDFIYEFLIAILDKFEQEFGDKIKNEFNMGFKPMELKDKFVLKNYLTYLTFVYNFCFHYKVDPIIKNSVMDAFFSVSLNINIPDIFISGMRMDNSKGNDIHEYWKDYFLIEDILNKIHYIFKNDYIKKKIFGENYKKDNKKENENESKYDKYNKILNEIILNKDKKDLFRRELFLLCYFEIDKGKFETIIPLIRILSISLICILTIVKDSNNEEQLKHWLKEYKDLLKFIIISSTNLNKNINNSSDLKIYKKIQEICFDVIASGLCFFNNLLECSTICKEIIKKYLNNIFLLCFSILKFHFEEIKNKKLFINKMQFDLSSCAVLILFNDYIKDKNKTPFINAIKLEKIYLNPSFKIVDLINENDFYQIFFENKNLKKQLFTKFYSINTYKLIVDNRYQLIRKLEDNLDYSYQINVLELLTLYERELLKYSNKSIKNRKKGKYLYAKEKKKLFSWNGFWSNKELFYGDINLNKIKYKVINHYTNSLMRPLISPILDINYYLPVFSQYKKENLFINKNNNEKDSNDLILDFDTIFKKTRIKSIESNNKNNSNKKIRNDNDNFKINSFIDENIKKISGLLKNDSESKENYLKYIYEKSNPKLYEYIKKISKILDLEKEEEQKEEIFNKKINNYLENEDNDIIKESERKDTVQTQRTSSSTIKKETTPNISSFKNNFVNLVYDKDNNKLKKEEILNNKEYFLCCLVKPSHHIKGAIYIREKKLNFKIFSDQKNGNDLIGLINVCFSEKENDYDKERGTCYGSYFVYHPKDKNLYKLSIIFNEIKWVLKRKYYYKNSAIEIFTIKNKSYYFNFKDEETQDIIINEIIKKIGNYFMIINDIKEFPNQPSYKKNVSKDMIIGYQNNSNPLIIKKNKFKVKKRIKLSKIINQWKNWKFSNFELLILLNIFSNRSYNDITQYPVFPWILSNYKDPLKTKQIQKNENEKDKEKEIEENKNIENYSYRDLSLPMGMLTINEDSIKRKNNYLSTYKILKQDKGNKPYLFGCNYSNPTYVCNYLIRLFPFTQVCLEIQGEGFDNPRRLFTSIEKAFKNALSQSTDVREIIPEFFYFPEIFLNINNLNLGKFDEKTIVNNVITPCDGNPYKFISTMRNVLENENISYSINKWIDLIFGIKAKGKEAENAKNIFTEQSYQEDININDIKEKDNFLRYGEFGLIPNQLFNSKEFPQKESIEEIKKIKQFMDNSYNLKKLKCKKNTNNITNLKEDSILLSITYISQEKIILFYNKNYFVEEKISYSIFDKEYNEEVISIKTIAKSLNKISNYYLSNINKNNNYNNKNIKIIGEGKILIMGGYYDGKIIIVDIENINNENSLTQIIPFKDESSPITVIHIDKYEQFLFVGNSLGNIRIIQIDNKNLKEWKMMYVINDLLKSVSSIDSNHELNIWASASINGYINIYTLPLCKLTKSFKISLDNICNYIYICDSPLPSILIIYEKDIYLYSINGFKIYNQKENEIVINPIIFKDFYGNDFLGYIINNKEIFIRNISDFSIQARISSDNEINYLCPGADMKILYAFNKNGTQTDVILCDNKKITEEN